MKSLHRWTFAAAIWAAFFMSASPVVAQWQVPDHSVPIGRGAGTGFKNVAPGPAGGVLTSNGASADPSFRSLGYDTPENHGAAGNCGVDETTAVQAAIDSGKNVFAQGCYLVSGVTVTSAFNGRSIFGVSNGNNGFKAIGNVPIITIDSTSAEVTRIEFHNILLWGSGAGTSAEAGIKFVGSNFIQHNTFSNIRCWALYACLNDASSNVNWSIFDKFQVTQTSQYGVLFTKGSGTGNVFNNWTAIVGTAGVQIGDGTSIVGDLIFTNMHLGASSGSPSGIKIIGSPTYGTLITINGSQFDAGIGCALDLVGPVDRVSGGGNNWGGLVTPVCKTGTVSSVNLMFSYVQTQTISADQNNYNPAGLGFTKQLRVTPTGSSRTITGLAAQFDGFEIELYNSDTTNSVTLSNNDAASSAANRFQFGGQVMLLSPSQSVLLRYDAIKGGWVAVASVIPASGVTAGTYGSATQTAQISITPFGTINGASNVTMTSLNGVSYPSSYTSGGIPYASASGAISTSSALAANAIVVGGGAGVAPHTVTTGTGVLTALGVNTGSAGAFVVNGSTASLSTVNVSTALNCNANAANCLGIVGTSTNSTGALFQNNDTGSGAWVVGVLGSASGIGTNGEFIWYDQAAAAVRFGIKKTSGDIRFTSATAATSAATGGLTVTGGIGIGGAIWAGTYLATTVTTVAALPACGAGIKGARMFVSDNATALAFAAVITTGGAIQTPVYCDGTVWRQG